MVYKILCSDGQTLLINIPNGESFEPGDVIACPSGCPKRKICNRCKSKGEFSLSKRGTRAAGDAPSYSYNGGKWTESASVSGAEPALKKSEPAPVVKEVFSLGGTEPKKSSVAAGSASAGAPARASDAAASASAEPATSEKAKSTPSWAAGLSGGVKMGSFGGGRASATTRPAATASAAARTAPSAAAAPTAAASATVTGASSFSATRDFSGAAAEVQDRALGGVSKSSFSHISIGGASYAVGFVRGCKPLKKALDDIFIHWNTSFVFKSRKELKREFKWLLLCTLDSYEITENEKIIGDILSTTYSTDTREDRNIKFFLIFYSVIYKNDSNLRFYFSEEEDTQRAILPRFIGREDFAEKFFGDKNPNDAFRQFYVKYRLPVLYYFSRLGIEDVTGSVKSDISDAVMSADKRFLDDVGTLYMQSTGCIAVVTRKGMNISVVNFGQAESLASAMCKPQSIDKMESLVRVLEAYRINSDMTVVRRGEGDRFVLSEKTPAITESESIYLYLGFPAGEALRAYNLYVSLLGEYIRIFEPQSINIGGISISRNGFISAVYGAARDICKYAYGKNNDTEAVNAARARAYLLKSLVDRGILDYYKRSCETSKLDRFLSLISSQDNVGEFFSLFGSDAKIAVSNRELSISQYIYEMISEHPYDVVTEMFKSDKLIRLYLSNDKSVRVNAMIAGAERIYEDTFRSTL